VSKTRRTEWQRAWSRLNGENGEGEPDNYSGTGRRKRWLRRTHHKASRKAAKEALRLGEEPTDDPPLDGWEVD